MYFYWWLNWIKEKIILIKFCMLNILFSTISIIAKHLAAIIEKKSQAIATLS